MQIFRLSGVPGHAQTKRVDAPLMQPVKRLKALGITLLRPFDRLMLGNAVGEDFLSNCQFCVPVCYISDAEHSTWCCLVLLSKSAVPWNAVPVPSSYDAAC